MRQFTGKTKLVDMEAQKPCVQKGNPWAFSLMIKCLIMLVMIFTAIFARVHFNDRTAKLERQAEMIRMELHQTDLEIQSLIAKREKMSSQKYIQGKIQDYRLALRPTSAGQIRYLKSYHTVTPGPRQQEYAVQNTGRSQNLQTADNRY